MVIVLLACILTLLLTCIITLMLLGVEGFVEGFVEALAGPLMVGFWLLMVGWIALVVLRHM